MSQSIEDDVFIPDTLIDFLKHYTRAVIRTQPEDLLQWSHKYFAALVKGDNLPIDQPSDRAVHNVRQLNVNTLKQLHSQLGKQATVSQRVIVLTWKSYNLAENCLTEAFTRGRFGDQVEWLKFLLLCCNFLGKSIRQALFHALCILNIDASSTLNPCVTFDLFKSMFAYLAQITNALTNTQVMETLYRLQQKTKNEMIRLNDFYPDDSIILDPPERLPQ